jgi:hypothetical protein
VHAVALIWQQEVVTGCDLTLRPHGYLSSPTRLSFLAHTVIFPRPHGYLSSPTRLSFLAHTVIFPRSHGYLSSPTRLSFLAHTVIFPPTSRPTIKTLFLQKTVPNMRRAHVASLRTHSRAPLYPVRSTPAYCRALCRLGVLRLGSEA